MKRTSTFMFLMLVVCHMLPNVIFAQGDWANFQAPQVTVDNQAGNHAGVALYTQLCQANGFNGIEDFVQNCCLTMAKTIYYSDEETNAHGLQRITYKLTDGGSLSYKSGAPPHIEVGFDVNHIVSFVNDYGNEAAITEVLGVLCHELTHGYQKEPKNAGQYDGNSDFYGEIEGLADLGRLLTGGFNPERFPSQGGTFKQGYTTTAFFYMWLARTQAAVEGNFIKDLNLTAQNMSTWSHEAMCQQLLGKSVTTLWNQYQQEIANYPWSGGGNTAVADFMTNSTDIQSGQSVQFTNLSENAVSYEWTFEGGAPSTSNEASPVVVYNNEGNFRVTLVAYGSNTIDTEVKDNYISATSTGRELVDITEDGGTISAQYSDSPGSEGVTNLIDNNTSSKFLTFNASAFVEYQASNAYVVTKYELTSANDAEERDPKSWTLQGSNDGSIWTVIDSRENQDFASRYETKEYTFNNTVSYQYYRVNLANNSGSILQLAELELYGTQGDVVVPQPVADFSSSATAVSEGETIVFTNLSTDATSYVWDVNGVTGTTTDFSHTFASAGIYTVTLTASSDVGSAQKSISITVSESNESLVDITEDGGAISAQYNDSPSSEGINNLIDNNTSSKFLTFNASVYVEYQASKAYVVSRYTLTSANDAEERDPKSWMLQGSNDGLNFTTIDTRNNEDFTSRHQTKVYTFSNSASYQFYRLDLTNNSGAILQLAELELFGQGGDVVVQQPIADFTASSTAIKVGETITFTNQSQNATSYLWEVSGTTSTNVDFSATFNNEGVYTVSLTATNGVESASKSISVSVTKDGGNTGGDSWDDFIYPTVNLSNKAGSHQGVALYTELCQANGFNSIEDFVKNSCLTIAKKLYYTVEEANAHGLRNIDYNLTDGGSLSAKGGNPPSIFITFDVNHIVSFSTQYGNDAAITEVLGVLCHELVHGYQKEPKNAGAYDGSSEFYGEIEGLADLGRLLTGGFNPARSPSAGGHWGQGYTTTAFFYMWLARTQAADEANCIKDINLTAKNMTSWSHDAMCQQLFGQSAAALWAEYQNEIPNYPWMSGSLKSLTTERESSDSLSDRDDFPTSTSYTVYPNPATDYVNITFNEDVAGAVRLYAPAGSAVAEVSVDYDDSVSISVGHLPAGIYIIVIQTDRVMAGQKIIIE